MGNAARHPRHLTEPDQHQKPAPTSAPIRTPCAEHPIKPTNHQAYTHSARLQAPACGGGAVRPRQTRLRTRHKKKPAPDTPASKPSSHHPSVDCRRTIQRFFTAIKKTQGTKTGKAIAAPLPHCRRGAQPPSPGPPPGTMPRAAPPMVQLAQHSRMRHAHPTVHV